MCATCVRSGNCQLQTLANDMGILAVPYEPQLHKGLQEALTTTFPLYHDYNKCDFVEVMACPGGCVGGGGQPISAEDEERY